MTRTGMTLQEFIVALTDLRARGVPPETPVKTDIGPDVWDDAGITFDHGEVRISA
jgi:hypothetical protein